MVYVVQYYTMDCNPRFLNVVFLGRLSTMKMGYSRDWGMRPKKSRVSGKQAPLELYPVRMPTLGDGVYFGRIKWVRDCGGRLGEEASPNAETKIIPRNYACGNYRYCGRRRGVW